MFARTHWKAFILFTLIKYRRTALYATALHIKPSFASVIPVIVILQLKPHTTLDSVSSFCLHQVCHSEQCLSLGMSQFDWAGVSFRYSSGLPKDDPDTHP